MIFHTRELGTDRAKNVRVADLSTLKGALACSAPNVFKLHQITHLSIPAAQFSDNNPSMLCTFFFMRRTASECALVG